MGNIYYVYEHIRPDTGAVFYVGKGNKDRIRSIKRIHNRYHENILKKLSKIGLEPEIRIIFETEDESESFRVEKERIAYWKERGVKLCNLTDGGEGSSNPHPEVRAKKSMSTKGKPNSAETKARMSEAAKLRFSNPEARKKISDSRKNSKKQILCITTGAVYESVTDAARDFDVTSGEISAVCKGKRHTVGGNKFCYFDQELRSQQKEKPVLNKRPIFCFEKNQTYESISIAAKTLGLHSSCISNVCLGNLKQTGGYTFKYLDAA